MKKGLNMRKTTKQKSIDRRSEFVCDRDRWERKRGEGKEENRDDERREKYMRKEKKGRERLKERKRKVREKKKIK